MSKYQPLSDRLSASPGDEWLTSFSELESVLGFPLPKAARSGRTWWTNDPEKSHSRSWAAHGWEVGDVDHAAERVVFRRGAASGVALQTAAELKPLAEAPPAKASTPLEPAAAESASVAAPAASAPAPAEPPVHALAIPPVPSRPAQAEADDAQPRTEPTLLSQALRPAALISAGFAVMATLSAVMLGRVIRRR